MPKSKTFVLRAKRIYCTWPKNNTPAAQLLLNLRNQYPDQLSWAVVCVEAHKDGSPHLHMVAEHATKFQFHNTTRLDAIGNKHGDYKAVKNSPWRVMKYVMKHGNYVSYGVDAEAYVKAGKAKKTTKFATFGRALIHGESLQELTLAHPGFVLQHLSKIQLFKQHVNKYVKRVQFYKLEWSPPVGKSLQDVVIASWLKKNIRTKRVLGQKMLWIEGASNLGKTRLVEQLKTKLMIYILPYDNQWFDDFDPKCTDLLVCDEYNAQYTLQKLNKLCGSEHFQLSRRGKAPIQCTTRPPMLILSNYSPSGAYHRIDETGASMMALKRRLNHITIDSRIDLTWPEKKDSINSNTDEALDVDLEFTTVDNEEDNYDTDLLGSREKDFDEHKQVCVHGNEKKTVMNDLSKDKSLGHYKMSLSDEDVIHL